jgi:hypothetical protein
VGRHGDLAPSLPRTGITTGRRITAIVLGVALVATTACRGDHHHETAATAERAVLERQLQGLRGLIAAAEKGPLVPFHNVLAVADEKMVQDLLQAGLPFERVVGGRYRIRVDRGEVHFDDGFGLLRLDGQATLVDAPSAASADVTVFGGLDIVELDPESGLLRGRVKIIALNARRVGVMGVKTRAGERLVEDLGREKLDSFSALASRLEIPVRLERAVQLPAVGPGGEIRIEAATIPLDVGVVDVKAFAGRLWVCVDAKVARPAKTAVP